MAGFSFTSTERFVTLLLGILALLGFVVRAKGKWDDTNATLRDIKKTFEAYLIQHDREHGRIDRNYEKLENQMDEHIGRHRRY